MGVGQLRRVMNIEKWGGGRGVLLFLLNLMEYLDKYNADHSNHFLASLLASPSTNAVAVAVAYGRVL